VIADKHGHIVRLTSDQRETARELIRRAELAYGGAGTPR
jgi:hypothetical protein